MSALADLLSRPGVVGCVDTSSLSRALYSTDASIYRIVPQAIARPHDLEELDAVIQACLASGMPITTRGAGTSCAGNAVGDGLILDVGRHLNRVLAIDPDARTATVEPGVVQSRLQAAAKPFGLRFGPDPSTANRCTIGGMIGNNACGPRALGYGRSADNIVSLDVITGTGEHLTLTRGDDSVGPLPGLRDLANAHLGTIRTEFGHFSRQVSGYSLEHLLPEHGFDVPAFFAGTEGTLGIITRATVKLVADAPVKQMVALGYPTMADAADAMPVILPFGPVACEGLDARIVDVVRRRFGDAAVPPLPRGEGWMFLEVVGEDAGEVRERAEALLAASGCVDGWVVTDPHEATVLWKIRADGAGLAGVSLEQPAYPGWEDAAVPPANLGAYLREFDALLTEHGMHGLPYGHFGDGCVHCRIDFPLERTDGTSAYKAFVEDAARLVARHGGSMSGEHGDGRARSALLPAMYSPEALALFGQVKNLFDPGNLLNPGVLVEPDPVDARARVPQTLLSPLRLQDPRFARDVHQCSGVGKCIADTTGSGGVMCPSFQATRDEKDSTRGRARVLQEMINGSLVDRGWRSPQVHEALDLCLSCKGCRRDCPTGIDMAAYKSRVLFEAFRGRLRPASHYALGWLPRWGRLVTAVPGLAALANAATQTPGVRHVVRALAGVDQRRPMPKFRTRGRARREFRHQQTAGEPVALWVDSFTDTFEGSQLQALVRVLGDAGYAPQVVQQDACCGLTWITTGQLDGARAQLRRALDVLAPIAEQGIPIVGLEPSCLAVWRSDAGELLPDEPRVSSVAAAVHTLAELLARTPGWTPPDLSGHTVVAQPHCHHASVLGWQADDDLLRRTGAEVVTLGGCCGLAGNFGVEKGHYDVSVAVAEHDLLPAVEAAGPDAIVLADGFSCRKQLSDLADRGSVTLAQLLTVHS